MYSTKWHVQHCAGEDHLIAILEFLLSEYERIFGVDLMNSEECVVFNDPQADCPMLIMSEPICIRLAQDSLWFWAQTIYQLSHELCHYAIRQCKKDKDFTLSWFEEIVCEAMSLYALHYAAENWQKCNLSKLVPAFGESIENYLRQQLKIESTDDFAQCNTISKLIEYETNEYPEKDRKSHRNERNIIYQSLIENPEDARCFLEYPQYVISPENIIIDFDRWRASKRNQMIDRLREIQPVKSE